MRIDANNMMSAYALSACSDANNDNMGDFAAQMCDELADEVAKADSGLEPGESRDYDGILDSQLAMGQHKRDMFLTVSALEEISEQMFNDHQRSMTRNQVDLHWVYL